MKAALRYSATSTEGSKCKEKEKEKGRKRGRKRKSKREKKRNSKKVRIKKLKSEEL